MDEKLFRQWLIGQLRRLSHRQPGGPGTDAFRNARVSYGKYKCSVCQGEDFGPKDIHKEHTQCVVPLEGFDNWDGIIGRMFCRAPDGTQDSSQLTIQCIPCHKAKTKIEAGIRAKHRRSNARKT